MKAVILNYTGGRANWGSQATSHLLAEFLVDALSATGVTELDTIPLPPPHVFDKRVKKHDGAKLAGLYANPSPTTPEVSWLSELSRRRFGSLLDRLDSAAIVFFQGEGSMSGTGFNFDLRLFAPLYLALQSGKPVITLNQSIAPADAQSQAIAANLFGRAHLNFFREPVSLRLAQALGIGRAAMCPDTVFQVARQKTAPAEKRTHFCVSGSAVLDGTYIRDFTALLSQIVQRHGLQPVFLASTGEDRSLHKAFEERHPGQSKLVRQSQARDYRDLLPIIEGAAFTIGGRYHTAIKSAALGVPVILLASNSHKSAGLSELLFQENRVRGFAEPLLILADIEAIMADWQAGSAKMTTAVQSMAPAFTVMKHAIRNVVANTLPPGQGHFAKARTARNAIANPKQAILGLKRSKFSMAFNRACYDCEWQAFPPQL
jgi:polysaccharide pyruvyl transferase WcaK-like protein